MKRSLHFTVLTVFSLAATSASAQSKVESPNGEPTNAKEAAAQKARETAELEAKYQAWVETLTPAQRAWEGLLQAELGGFYLPIHKREKVAGKSNAWDFVEDDPALPRVLLIGDSVSRAYTQTVRKELAGKVNVHRAPANCGPTATGLKKIGIWLGGGKWDVIHFNFGIHDRNTPIADYTQRLEQLVERMKQTGATLIWANTTPVPDVPGKYTAASIVERNAAAAVVMTKHGIPIDDLFAAITPRLTDLQNPNDVHFSGPGNEFLGKQVAQFLAARLLATVGPATGLLAEEKPVSILAARIGGHVHPSICQTRDGTLIVVYKGANVLMVSRSTDSGDTWSKPEPIATSAIRPDVIRKVEKFEVYPGTVDVLPDDRVLVTWNYIADDKARDGYYERALLYTISSDGGRTWIEQQLIGPIDGKHLGAVRHNVLSWTEDRWLLPLRVGPPRLFDPSTGELTVFPVVGPDGEQHEFQQIVRTAKGTLLAMGPVLLHSADEGKTWSQIEDFPAVPDKRDNAEGRFLTTLTDGRVLATWGIGHDNKGLRYNLSLDDGRIWDKNRTVILLPEMSIAARYYSGRTVQLDGDHVGTVFMNPEGVHFLKVRLDRLINTTSGAVGQEADHTPALQVATRRLGKDLAALKLADSDLLADARIFHKGAVWALRYDTTLSPKDLTLLNTALDRGTQRAEWLKANKTPWTTKKGKVLRGFFSAVDGSTQPYGVVVPENYDGTKPMRLDVVLHGSSKPVGMSELRFGARFDDGDEDGGKPPPDADYIELHPLGRVENCYRWAGETDVFEAVEAVCRNYRIDRDRIVLRGMSMGASGTWHLGLKHPDRFVAIGPYCGYVDTHRFSETPIPNFIKVGPLPPHQESGLHMLDSVDYAANASAVPAIAAIGDQDVFFQAHVIMGEAFSREGLTMVNLISPGTGHKIDPVTHAEQMRRIGEFAAKGLDHAPKQLRFVTWTLKYNRCHWLELLGLGKHYDRAEFQGSVSDDGGIEISELKNITRFAIHRPVARMRILEADIAIPSHDPNEALVFAETNGAWQCEGPLSQISFTGKRPGLQGPIDDAFATPFLCVRGTGKPWNPEVEAWADASLRRFEYEWARYMRGDLPVKNDTEVTEADVREKHLILFGDPGSNSWIAKVLPKLPVTWTRDEVSLGKQPHSATDHAPVFISASPLADNRYLVINSGHTFHEKAFAAFNYLLFPRLGDWAVMKVPLGADQWQPTSPDFPEQVVRAGYFDEDWQETLNQETENP